MQHPFVPAENRSPVRKWARQLLVHALRPCHPLLGCRGSGVFGILTYHRVVAPTRGVPRPEYNVPPERLRAQLTGLRRRGFEAWPLSRVLNDLDHRRPIPRRVFVVTFDDGYENNLTQALPVLRELGVPATIFLATSYLGTDSPFPFDRWAIAHEAEVPAEAWRPLTWEAARHLLAEDLVEIGCHTHTHALFCDDAEFADDLQQSLEILREELGIGRPAFSFPFGICNGHWRDIAQRSGVSCALSVGRRLARTDQSAFTWGRFGVSATDSPSTIAVKLSGWYDAAYHAATRWTTPAANAAGRQPSKNLAIAPCAMSSTTAQELTS